MELDQTPQASVAYLVHDLTDAAVCRRVDLLIGEGFVVKLGGFRRHAITRHASLANSVTDLGQTKDARLGQRIAAILRHMLAPAAIKEHCAGSSVIVARNLEMLVLAWRVRKPGQRLVYECLDIHRLMLGTGGKSRLLRKLERWLLVRTDLVIVSSPAFADRYFRQKQGRRDHVLLVENKVAAAQARKAPLPRADNDAAIVVGWFGMLRCRQTFEHLARLVRESGGRIQVLVAGIASSAEFPDFAAEIREVAGMTYSGQYAAQDLGALYAAVDFVWAIDYFEEGLNSAWLLPNRLYEGLAQGVVPIALRNVETGRWLARHGVGLLIDDAGKDLPGKLITLSPEERRSMRLAIAALPEEALYQTGRERRSIARAIAG
ncbi:glycosyltransferase [Novosphingobium guangzhouense]|uniref:Glycosyltransferase subfamily 4-like N-terminal domain-containing protein n=1 Tax=Novosphingobium guangzhouense TaxID=1850347 RepID=A0A2K2FWM3_9SPHN|nr:glycosyltransferase [Novosphingobium guangzhouense]PNU03173.1 hypothetical protein A8V01_24535 [Novosphingobium guangzhouense]